MRISDWSSDVCSSDLVAIFAKQKPDAVLDRLGVAEFDDEGRYLELRYGDLSIVSLYLPSGSSGPERQASKDRFLAFFQPVLRQWLASGRRYVVVGDWNIAPRNIEIGRASCRENVCQYV